MTREEQLENVLHQLISKHFFTARLEWGYGDKDACLLNVDLDLYLQIAQLVPEAIKEAV